MTGMGELDLGPYETLMESVVFLGMMVVLVVVCLPLVTWGLRIWNIRREKALDSDDPRTGSKGEM